MRAQRTPTKEPSLARRLRSCGWVLADGNRQSFDLETDERDNVFGTFD